MADPSGYGSATTYTSNTISDSVRSSHRYCKNNLRGHQEIKPEHHQAITIRVHVCLLKQEIDAIVDTGAEVTVVLAHIFNSLPKNKQPPLLPASHRLTSVEVDNKMETCGIVETKIAIGNHTFIWPVYIASIKDDMLLGCDVFDAFNMILNSSYGLKIGNEWVSCNITRTSESIARVSLKSSLTIPPNSEILTSGVLENHKNITTCLSLVEPVENLGNKEDVEENTVIVARTLVNPNAEGIPIRLINLSSEPKEIQRGQTLGEIVPIKELIEFGMEDKHTNTNFNEYHRICRIHQNTSPDRGIVPNTTSR